MILGALMFTLLFDRAWQAQPGPMIPPTKGEVWPKPQSEKKELILYKFNKAKFTFKILNNTCKTLTDAVDRVRKELYKMHNATKDISPTFVRYLRPKGTHSSAVLHRMDIEMSGPCEEYPYLGMDESYQLTVSTVSKLMSPSLWGMLRGLESFLQLFYISHDHTSLLVMGTSIYDFPRYPHRGLLLDTARHYLPTDTIKTALDAMAMNKLNVFHWHIVDDHSFPYQSEKYPEMSEKGAYNSTMVYTKSDILDIVDYAKDRGIRVIPEMDLPGHTRSWGNAYPELLAACIVDDMEVEQGPLEPTNDYNLLDELFEEMQQWFPDEYIHLGGVETVSKRWGMCPYLSDEGLLEQYNMSVPQRYLSVFFTTLIPLLGNNKTHLILWQDVIKEGVALPNGTLIQIWKENWVELMNTVLSRKMRVVHSTEWFLDEKSEWEKMYLIDPRSLVNDVLQLDNVVGGEICIWGKHVDSDHLISRVWPEASAVAERLWSNAILDDAIKQINQNPIDQPPSSVEPAPDHPRSLLEPAYQHGVHLISNEVIDINRKSSYVDYLPHQASKNIETMSQTRNTFEPLSQTSSTFEPVSQTSSTFEPVYQISSTFEPVSQRSSTIETAVSQTSSTFEPVSQTSSTFEPVSQTSSTFDPVSQTSSTFQPVSQTSKLKAVTNSVDQNLFEKSNLVMEQLLWNNDLQSVRSRLQEHACRMITRGVPAQPPKGPGSCVM